MLSSYAFLWRGVYLSAIDLLPGLDGDTDFLAVLAGLEPNAGRLAIGSCDRDLGNMHGRRATVDAALRVGLARLAVTRGDVDAVDHHLAVLGQDLSHRAGAALVLAGQDNDAV